jgi:CheY-like chemotaxis protein
VVKADAGDKLRVLVVENEPIAREILGDLLKMAGYEVLAAHTGEHALLTLVQERGRIDCLFTALDLPGLVDGWMLADEFRVADAALPVVFAARAKPGKARRPQGAAFVAHPVLPPKAVEAVNKVTGRASAGPKSRRLPRVVVEAAAPQPVETPPIAASVGLLKAAG